MKKKYLITLFLLLNNNVNSGINLPDIKKIKPIYKISELKKIKQEIKFHNEFEKPFLTGIPNDLPVELIKKNLNAPHCFEPFNLPSPWHSINYDRLPYLLILSDYFIDPNAYGTIFNDEQELILKYNHFEVCEKVKFNKNSKLIKIDKAAHLLQKCTDGYYHFLIEVLPRLTLILSHIKADPSIKLLLSAPQKKFMDEYLDIFGIDPKRVIYCDPKYIYHVSELYFPRPAYMGYPSKEELNRVRNYILNKFKTNDEPENNEVPIEKRDLVIIIERLEPRRHVNNTSQIIQEIKKTFPELANKIEVFSKASVKEQISLFKRAKIIIGPHGAGFSNMLFAGPGTNIIEFIPIDYFGILFWHMSQALGFEHHHIIVPNANKNSSFNVNPQEVIKKIKKILLETEIKKTNLMTHIHNINLEQIVENINKELDFYGNTLLIYAASYNYLNLAKMLINFGADPFKKNKYGNDTFDHALLHKSNQQYKEVINWLKTISHNLKDFNDN